MNCNDVKPGLHVRVNAEVEREDSTVGMLIVERHLQARRKDATGEVLRYVPGHGGDVWFVKHHNSEDVAAYVFTEIDPL